jgi:hypothetical protein
MVPENKLSGCPHSLTNAFDFCRLLKATLVDDRISCGPHVFTSKTKLAVAARDGYLNFNARI